MKAILLSALIVAASTFAFAQGKQTQKIDAYVLQGTPSSSNSIALSAHVQGVNFQLHSIKGKSYTSIDMPNMVSLLTKGAPNVQQITASVIIPDLEAMKVKVVNAKYKDYQNVSIAPSKGNLTRDIDPNQVPFTFSKVYQKDAFYPGKLAELRTPYVLRDFRAQTVVFYPFQYNPVTKVLRVYSSIDIEMIPDASLHAENPFVRTKNSTSVTKEYSHIYKRQFLNYNSLKYTPLAELGNLLIIADSSYLTAMKPYLEWKTRTGRPTKMVSIQSVGNTTTAIKTYILNYYNTKGLAFVLLVGDAAQITTNNLSGNHSDNFYGYLLGNDSYPEVIVGRFSAETRSDVETQVNRTIAYERSPGINNGSYSRSIGLSSNQGPGDDNEYDYEHIRNMQLDLDTFNYSYHAELFDGNQGGNDASGDPNSSMVSTELNNGSGVVLYTGHGSSSSFVSSGFSSSHISALNNVGKLPFIWSVACVNGDFVSNTCFAEYWMRSRNSGGESIGAVATLMSTINQSWDPPMHGQDEMVDILVESYQNNIKRTFGGLSLSGCMKMNDDYGSQGDDMTDTWNLFGDPTLMVRTDTPSVLTVTHQPTMNIGSTQLPVQVNINGALVALTKDDSIYATAYSVNGVANLTFGGIATMDTFLLTVTAFNHIPYLADVLSISSSLPYVFSKRYYVNDLLTNNNRKPENGESVQLAVCLQNSGGVSTTGLTAKLKTTSALVTLTDSVASFGTLNVSDSLMLTQAFAFTVMPQVLNQSLIPFIVEIEDVSGNLWSSPINVLVNAPEIMVSSKLLVEVNGNGNGVPDAGEDFEIQFVLKNVGKNDLNSILADVSTSTSNLTVSVPSVSVSTLGINATYNCTYPLHISSSTPVGSLERIDFSAVSGIYSTNDNVVFKVGIVSEDFETGDFLKYTWQSAGDKPWVTDVTTKYEGSYSARSGLSQNDLNKESIMNLDLKVLADDSLSFYVKVSCEDGAVYNQWYDFLEFEIDGVRKDRWQGDMDWKRVAFPIDSGSHTVSWTYQKDNYSSAGSDCGWVDFIVFPPMQDHVGIQNASANVSAKLFPNPTHQQLHVSFELDTREQVAIRMFSQEGRLLKSLNPAVYIEGTHTEEISVEGLSSGVYFVQIKGESFQTTIPFIKQ